MNKIAIALITAGFLAGAFVAVLDPRVVEWSWFLPAIAAGFVGVFLTRRARHQAARASHKIDADLAILKQSLERIVENLDDLHGRRDSLPPYEVRFDIDRLFRTDLNAFADARECMVHRFGLRYYAEVMSAFAAGERYINRVWSASTDGYVDEVLAYLVKARNQFTEARDRFAEIEREMAAHPAM